MSIHKATKKVFREVGRPFKKFKQVLHANYQGLTLKEYNQAKRFRDWRHFLNDERLYTSCRPEERKDLFAKYVKFVEIEVFSFCNRRCWFCPNAYIDRHSENRFMPPEMYSKIIGELAEIGYSGKIWYSRYNEPFSDRIILDRIREARTRLPDVTLHSFTNGDYITRDYLEEIAEAGLNHIKIMRYPPRKDEYSEADAWETLYAFAGKMNLEYEAQDDVSLKLLHPVMCIEVLGMNLDVFVRNRAGAVATSTETCRNSPCFSPFTNMYIDYNGSVMPCCNMRSDVPQHTEMIMGNVGEKSIFDIYANLRYSLLRYQMRDFGLKVYPCNICDNRGYSFSGKLPNQ